MKKKTVPSIEGKTQYRRFEEGMKELLVIPSDRAKEVVKESKKEQERQRKERPHAP